MVAALGPVEAAAYQRPATARRQLDPELLAPRFGVVAELDAVVGALDDVLVGERVGDRDAQLSGEVVVAGAAGAQRVGDDRVLEAPDRRVGSERGERLDGVDDLLAGEAVVAVAAVLLDLDEAAVDELAEVVAGGRQRDPGDAGELAGGERVRAREGQSMDARAGSPMSAATLAKSGWEVTAIL